MGLDLQKNYQDLISTFEKMNHDVLDETQMALFEFMINVRQYQTAYEESGELWEKFGDFKGPQLINIEVNFLRTDGAFKIWRFKPEGLFQMLKSSRKEWAQSMLTKLTHVSNNCMAVYYTDDELSQRFGFPFSATLVSERPE